MGRLGSRSGNSHPQDPKKLRRQHHGAVLTALAVTNGYDAAAAVIADLQPDGLRGAKTRCVGRRQRRARLQARHCFQEVDDLVRAENHRQRAWRAGINDPFRDLGMAQARLLRSR
ncbi:hypothetical protein CK224_04585 [Mesorhizobium sp. WSM3862]|nr:hypothetical protein CK224_04585 [Mesorhizobium sp. WSM3862]